MGMGKKKSAPAPAEPKPVMYDNNDNVPDDVQKRGIPIRDDGGPAASQSLLHEDKDRRKQKQEGSMLY